MINQILRQEVEMHVFQPKHHRPLFNHTTLDLRDRHKLIHAISEGTL